MISKYNKTNRVIAGFTLIELLVVVSVTGIILTVVTDIFYRSVRGNSRASLTQSLDRSAEHIISRLNSYLPDTSVVSVGSGANTKTRDDCLLAGVDGLSASILDVKDSSGLIVRYYLDNSGVFTSGVDALNDSSLFLVSGLSFRWYCGRGSLDRLNISFTAVATGVNGVSSITRDYKLDVLLRNTGV